MTTIIKSIVELPIVSQIFVYVLFFLIIMNVITIKFVFKWWQKLLEQLKKQQKNKTNKINHSQQKQQQNIIQTNYNQIDKIQINENKLSITKLLLLLISSFTIIEPFATNFSCNKIYLLFLTSIWIFLLLCTDIFTPLSSQIEHSQNNLIGVQYEKLFYFLSWNGIALAIFDICMRFFCLKNINKKNENRKKVINKTQTISMSEQINNSTQNQLINSNQSTLPLIVYFYSIIVAIISIILLILSMYHILSTNSFFFERTNFYIKIYSFEKIIKVVVSLSILYGVQHGFILLIGMGIFVFFKVMYTQEVNINCQWNCLLGQVLISKRIKEKITPNYQQSKQNLGQITNRNKLQDIYTQNVEIKNIKCPQQDILKANSMKRKSILVTSNQNKIFHKNQVQNNNQSTNINKNETQLDTQINKKQKRRKKKSKMIFFNKNGQQNDKKEIQQPQELVTQTNNTTSKLKEKQQLSKFSTSKKVQNSFRQQICDQFDPNLGSQPILRNIENKICQSNKNKIKCKQLKIIDFDFGNENLPGVDFIDLSQYVIKDLGCANSEKQQNLQIPKKNQKKLIFIETPQSCTSNKPIDHYIRKKKSFRAPSIPDIKADAFTFCMQDVTPK